MVTMKNIENNGDIITMNCYVEGDQNNSFSLAIDAHTFDIIKSSAAGNEFYARQARNRIWLIWEENQKLPEETCAVWC